MSLAFIPGLVLYAFVSSITPGPNNLMLMASGANFGFRRSIPHMLGIAVGFGLMAVIIGIGLSALFEAYPVSYTILKVGAVCYLLYLAWKIAHAAAPGEGDPDGRPFSFLQAAAFQWINPKAVTMALTAITLFAPDRSFPAVLAVAVIFAMVNLPSVSCWTVLGTQLRRLLTNTRRLQIFNWSMALLLVASLYPALTH